MPFKLKNKKSSEFANRQKGLTYTANYTLSKKNNF